MDSIFDVERVSLDGHARVRFVGELDMAEVDRAEADVVEVLDRSTGDLSIDLSGLTFCDSSGARLLCQLDREARARGRTMVLQSPTPAVHRVLSLLGVVQLVTIEDVCSDA
jgi:anti-sigma B factor antagonist